MERRICKSRILAGVVIMLALFLSVSQPAFAAPSQSGKSGLLLAPSADTLGQGSLAIGYSRLGLTDCVYKCRGYTQPRGRPGFTRVRIRS